jgi:hypothetical protein
LFDQINSWQRDLTNTLATLVEVVDEIDEENDYTDTVAELKNSSSEAEKNINSAKSKLSHYAVSLCTERIKSGTSFNEAKKRVQSVMGFNINFYESLIGADKISIFANFDILSRTGKVYTLVQSDEEMNLITINIIER